MAHEDSIRETEWIPLDQTPLRVPHPSVIGGVEVGVFTSPLDLPLALRASFNPVGKRLTIEFRYGFDEPREKVNLDGRRVLWLGKASGRVLGLEMDMPSNAEEAVEGVREALLHLAKNPRVHRRHLRTDNARAASEAVRFGWPRLAPAMATAF